MSENRKLLIICGISLASLIVIAIGLGGLAAFEELSSNNSLKEIFSYALGTFIPTIIIGIIPAIFYGPPLYVYLMRKKLDKWYFVIVIGILPGFLLMLLDNIIGVYAIFCGGIAALLTHLLWSWFGSNKTFSRTRDRAD
jgi:hypothetical protein